jgi:hypothetical protein
VSVRAVSYPEEFSCQKRIEWLLTKNSTLTEAQAGGIVARRRRLSGNFCQRCDPSSCPKEAKRRFRLDEIAPRILSSSNHYLHSIKPEMRLPPRALHNLTDYFSRPGNVFPAREYFFEFNPSIARLPTHQIPKHLLNTNKNKAPVYVASYRISNQNYCVRSTDYDAFLKMVGGNLSNTVGPKADTSYLGISILAADLSILDETVVKVINKFDDRRALFPFQDARLFEGHRRK